MLKLSQPNSESYPLISWLENCKLPWCWMVISCSIKKHINHNPIYWNLYASTENLTEYGRGIWKAHAISVITSCIQLKGSIIWMVSHNIPSSPYSNCSSRVLSGDTCLSASQSRGQLGVCMSMKLLQLWLQGTHPWLMFVFCPCCLWSEAKPAFST